MTKEYQFEYQDKAGEWHGDYFEFPFDSLEDAKYVARHYSVLNPGYNTRIVWREVSEWEPVENTVGL